MKQVRIAALCAGAALSMALVSLPGQVRGEGDAFPRYTLAPIEGGIIRLDTVTGEVSHCRGEGAGMVCRLLPDERTAYVDAIDGLEARLAELERKIAKLQPAGRGKPEKNEMALADEAELDRAFDLMQNMMRRFFGMVREFKDEMDSSTL